jgi:hypothetical protein
MGCDEAVAPLLSWPGIVPAISLRKAPPCLHKRDARDKPAHDKRIVSLKKQ